MDAQATKTLNTVLEEVIKINREIVDIKGVLVQHGDRMDRMETKIGNIEMKVDSMGNRIEGIEVRMDSMEIKMGGMEAKMNGLEIKMDSMEAKIDGVEAGMAEMRAQAEDYFYTLKDAIFFGFNNHERRMLALENA